MSEKGLSRFGLNRDDEYHLTACVCAVMALGLWVGIGFSFIAYDVLGSFWSWIASYVWGHEAVPVDLFGKIVWLPRVDASVLVSDAPLLCGVVIAVIFTVLAVHLEARVVHGLLYRGFASQKRMKPIQVNVVTESADEGGATHVTVSTQETPAPTKATEEQEAAYSAWIARLTEQGEPSSESERRIVSG